MTERLDTEGRAVISALVIQIAGILLLTNAELLSGAGQGDFLVLSPFLVLLIGLGYFPEVTQIAQRSKGASRNIDIAYATLLLVAVLPGLEQVVVLGPVIWSVIIGLAVLWLVVRYTFG